jgi:ABC-type phosphate transport system substrate-binding protein
MIRLIPFVLASALAFAGDLVVVVNAASSVERMKQEEVINLFMGRTRKLPSGITALPIDQGGPQQKIRAAFYRTLVGKELPEINAYWARLLFSGQANPPRQAESEEEVLEILRNNKGAIGYVSRSRVDKRLRIVYEVDP